MQNLPLNAHADIFSMTRGLKFGPSHHLHPTLRMRAANVQVSLHICAGLPEPLLLGNVKSNKGLYAGSFGPGREKTCLRGF